MSIRTYPQVSLIPPQWQAGLAIAGIALCVLPLFWVRTRTYSRESMSSERS